MIVMIEVEEGLEEMVEGVALVGMVEEVVLVTEAEEASVIEKFKANDLHHRTVLESLAVLRVVIRSLLWMAIEVQARGEVEDLVAEVDEVEDIDPSNSSVQNSICSAASKLMMIMMMDIRAFFGCSIVFGEHAMYRIVVSRTIQLKLVSIHCFTINWLHRFQIMTFSGKVTDLFTRYSC